VGSSLVIPNLRWLDSCLFVFIFIVFMIFLIFFLLCVLHAYLGCALSLFNEFQLLIKTKKQKSTGNSIVSKCQLGLR